jgi:hypothetical protein
MSNWEKCRDFGLVKVNPSNNVIHLYKDPYTSETIIVPGWKPVIESVNWQGNNLVVRSSDDYGNKRHYIYRGFHDYEDIR